MRRGIELEVKFAPVGEHTLDELAARTEFPGWRILSRHTEAQHNTYFDTPDALLEAARCSLRRRIINAGASGVEWTFKRGRGPGRDGVARRREVNALLPGKKTELPKGKCEPVTRARLVAGEQPLEPLFTLLTDRQQIELARADGARVALALDRLRLEGESFYRETEIEIELYDGDERAVADLALWLMRTYGLLPMRGSKRGRALAWRRGLGLPVVAPALALELLAERATMANTKGDPAPVIALASPLGSAQAEALAAGLLARLPGATIVTTRDSAACSGPLIMVGMATLERADPIIRAWVKVGLPRLLLRRLTDDAAAIGLDPWTILRRLGAYVVPSQRRFLDPAARQTDLIVIDNAPVPSGDQHITPTEQMKFLGWPTAAALANIGARHCGNALEHDRFFRSSASAVNEYLRVRLRDDTAWVSFALADNSTQVTTYEARPRVVPLLHNLGYGEVGQLVKERQRYRLGGWEIALDKVVQLGHFCELRRIGADNRDLATIVMALGFDTVARTGATYRSMTQVADDIPANIDPVVAQA